MRYALLTLLFAASNASACWCGPWHSGYYVFPRLHGYYPSPAYASSGMQPYAQPMWEVPGCPPTSMPPPQVVPGAPPSKMPDRKDVPKASAETPYSPIAPAGLSTPMEEKPESKIPKVEVPTTPMPKELPIPKLEETPKTELPKLEVPPVKMPEPPKIDLPPLNAPNAPKIDLPPLSIPSVPEKSTSKYRPTGQATLIPVDGTAPRDGQYRIGFFNYLDRDVSLVVNGATITLPKKSSTTATVGRSFRWSLDGGESETASVPDGAAGAEVVIR